MTSDPKTDQETTQSALKDDCKTDQEQSLTDHEGWKSVFDDQELSKSDQIIDQKTKILNLIKSNPKLNRLEISKMMSLHESSVKRRLEGLISEGLIRRIGSTKAGYWEVL